MILYFKIPLILAFLRIRASAFRARAYADIHLSSRQLTNLSGGAPPPLRLFGSTWNAYNRIWNEASDADDMIRTVIEGHDEADLVMIGFQEYYDEANDGASVADRLESQLWKGVFAAKAHELHEMPRKEIPEQVYEAKQKILDQFKAFHGEVDQALRDVGATFGKASENYIPALRTSLQGVDNLLKKHNREDYDQHFSKINAWSEALRAEHRTFLDKNPNFRLDDEGHSQHLGFMRSFTTDPSDAYGTIESRYADAKEKIDVMLQDAEAAAAQVVAEKIAGLQAFMNTWMADVNTYVGRIGKTPRGPLNLQHRNLQVRSISEIFDSDSKLRKRKDDCHRWPANHYNTDLRIFVNPWTGWRLDHENVHQYSIDYNGEAKGFMGKDGQCGKGANVVKARLVAYTGHELNVCMLNAHFSFKYSFLHRLHHLKDVFSSLEGGHEFNDQNLHCDIVVFTADFNSRLMCKPAAGNHSTIDRALCDTPASPDTGPTGNSFKTVLDTFCDDDGRCSLSANDQNAQADELTQFLKNDKIACFEHAKADAAWELHDVDNVLYPMGVFDGSLREAAPPNFGPTYKLAREKDALKTGTGNEGKLIADWSKCLPLDPGVCLLNKEQDFKHNPAWTDRIVVKDSTLAKITTDFYERRTFTSEMCHKYKQRAQVCSDHAVVTAMLSVTLSVDVATAAERIAAQTSRLS